MEGSASMQLRESLDRINKDGVARETVPVTVGAGAWMKEMNNVLYNTEINSDCFGCRYAAGRSPQEGDQRQRA